MKKKVHVVEYEIISPIGLGHDALFEGLKSDVSAERTVSRFPVNSIPFKKAAEVQTDLSAYYAGESDFVKETIRLDRKFELLAACYGMAAPRLGELQSRFEGSRTGVLVGVGADVTPFEYFEKELGDYIRMDCNPFHELIAGLNKHGGRVNAISNPHDLHALYLAEKFGARAFQQTILTACVSSAQALAFGYDAIVDGRCDVAIAGGTDSIINMLALVSFGKLGVIAESDDRVSCRPFDRNRGGTLAGESAGFAVLCSEDFAEKNKLQPYAEFLGYGNTLDAYKITAPDPSGVSIAAALKNALTNSDIEVSQLDYINAHGTGTVQNDLTELQCIEKAFGPEVRRVPISSTKDRHGHAIAAAGIQELCLLLECFRHDFVPGNRNLQSPCDPGFNLPVKNERKKIKYALSNSFAFGGINTVLALKNEF